MARRVFVHVGCPKTGTSYLQSVVWNKVEVLQCPGVLIPATKRHHYRAARRLDDRPIASRDSIDAEWDELVDEVKRFSSDVLISHDLFSPAPQQRARGALADLKGTQSHVIITARDLARQVPAEWQQGVKQGSARRFDDFVDHVLTGPRNTLFWQRQDVVAVARRWGSNLPASHVHVVTCPPRGADPEVLWKRFSSVMAIDDTHVDLGDTTANESLGLVEVELMRRINEIRISSTDGPGSNRWFRDRLAHAILARRGDKERFAMSPEGHRRIREICFETVARLEEDGYDVVGDLAELVPPVEPETGRDPSQADNDQLLDAALGALVELSIAEQDRAAQARPAASSGSEQSP